MVVVSALRTCFLVGPDFRDARMAGAGVTTPARARNSPKVRRCSRLTMPLRTKLNSAAAQANAGEISPRGTYSDIDKRVLA